MNVKKLQFITCNTLITATDQKPQNHKKVTLTTITLILRRCYWGFFDPLPLTVYITADFFTFVFITIDCRSIYSM